MSRGYFCLGYVKGAACHPGSVFPVSLDELVPDDHVCRVIEAFVSHLDLAELDFRHSTVAATGCPPYDPADLLKLYVYGYLHQTHSSRKLEPECQRTVDVMGLLTRPAPDVKTLARVRQANPKAVWAAQRRANEQARLAAEIGHSLDQPDGADESDETRFEGDAVRSARTLLDETGRPSVALTEPEARSMRATEPGDHVQRAVDADHHLIVHQEVPDDVTDHPSLAPVAKGAKDVTGSPSMTVLADAGDAKGSRWPLWNHQASRLRWDHIVRSITRAMASALARNDLRMTNPGRLTDVRRQRYGHERSRIARSSRSLAVSLPDPSAPLGDAPLLGSGVAANRKTDHGATDALAGPSPGAPLWHLGVSDR